MEPPAAFDLKKEARKVFESILLDEPDHFYSLYGKALTLWKEAKVDECIELMNRALVIQPADSTCKIKEMKDKMEKVIDLKRVRKIGNVFIRQPIPIAGHKIGQLPMTIVSAKDRVHHCKICDKNFTKMFSLNRHMLLHTGEKPHKCGHCRKAFIQKTDMERHETTHSDILNFPCTICEKRFKTKKNLNCHLVTHSAVRPFKCRYCEKDFKVKRLWAFHEGLHKETKPFNCDICGKGFPAKPYMKSHLKTHVDEKPFICVVCNFGFKRNYDLNFHIRNQHKDYVETMKAQ